MTRLPRSLALSLALSLCLLSCKREPAPDDVAAQTAKAYYDHLLQERFADYVDGTYRPDSIPGTYRQQLIDNAKMYAAQMRKEHMGIVAFSVGGVKYDAKSHSADVYLIAEFGDSNKEQILVPMVEHNGVWYMR